MFIALVRPIRAKLREVRHLIYYLHIAPHGATEVWPSGGL
jgi:hypothetical protein